jgi:DNA-binding FadR family transcriptional regulator
MLPRVTEQRLNEPQVTGRAVPRASVPRASVAAAKALLDYIDAEGLEPGDSLPVERDMLEWLGVARSTLREALRLLETQGIVDIRAGRGGGPTVGVVGPDDHVSSSTMLLQFMRVRFDAVLDARVSIEPEIAAAAATARGPVELADLDRASAGMLATPADPATFQREYNRFHQVLGEATHNPLLVMTGATFRRVWESMHSELVAGPRAVADTARAHRVLFEAVRDRDPAAAHAASRRHLTGYREWVTAHRPEWLERRVEWIVAPR